MRSEQDISLLIMHGLGVEGRATLPWFLERSTCRIIAIDKAEAVERLPDELRRNERISFVEENRVTVPEENRDTTLYLRSPGIPPRNKVVAAMAEAGIASTTPTGYWIAQHAPAGTITITGTKGKSSTASLTASLLKWCGVKAEEMGNIGRTPYEANPGPDTVCVFELSSYMMHDLPQADIFHTVTSLYTEHTDWHGTHEAYAEAKMRPWFFDPPAPGLTSGELKPYLPEKPEGVRYFEDVVPITAGTIFLGQGLTFRPADYNEAFKAPTMVFALRTAIAIAKSRGLAEPATMYDTLEKHLPTWSGLECRQQIITSTDGKIWVDDSLATVPEATESALTRWARTPIHLILGGKDRGQSFGDLMATCALRQDVRLYGFGDTLGKLADAAEEAALGVRFHGTKTLEDAITMAAAAAKEGEIILFSPAASSSEIHGNYKVRSGIFRQYASGGPGAKPGRD